MRYSYFFAFVQFLCWGFTVSVANADVLQKTLPNRMRVVVVEDHAAPAVFIRVLLPLGENDDPAGRAGVSDLTAELVQKGAGGRSAAEMAELVDWMGAGLLGYSEAEYTVIGCDVLAEHLDAGLELARDMVTAPRLDAGEFSILKDQAVASIKARRSDPSYLAAVQLPPAVFGPEAPQGKVKTEESLGDITLEDVAAFHRHSLNASGAIALVIGDVDAEALADKLAAVFGKLPAGEPPHIPTAIPANRAGGRMLQSPKESISQTTAILGKPGPGRLDPDYFPALVANYVLGGGGFVSRLMAALRSQEGKTYGIRSSISGSATPDLFTVKFTTRNEELAGSLRLTFDVMRRFIAEGPTDTEVSEAKEFFKGYYFLQTETPSQRASKMLAHLFYGLGIEEMDRYPGRIDAVTQKAAHDAAKRHLSPDGLTVSLCGPSDVLQNAAPVLDGIAKGR
ncbi:insulinase family protein [bacterium]|nr:insulinase family protein [bacterium]